MGPKGEKLIEEGYKEYLKSSITGEIYRNKWDVNGRYYTFKEFFYKCSEDDEFSKRYLKK